MATVRLFTCSGLAVAPVVAGSRLSYDSVQLLKFPLLGRDILTPSTGATDISEAAQAPANTTVAYVQVEKGKEVYYEVIPEGFDVTAASSSSPIMSGSMTLLFGPGWRLSVLEVA